MSKRTLLPMWIEGDFLYSFSAYKELHKQMDIITKRVWVGLDKDMTNEPVIRKDCVDNWIFEDIAKGYREVKRFNNSAI